MKNSLIAAPAPHLHSEDSTRKIMLDVVIALLPAMLASIWLFGWRALCLQLICVASCMAAEYLACVVLKKRTSVGDLSCVVTGLLLAFNLPATLDWWKAVLGCVVAIVVVKMMFGGIGHNFVNPALVGRIVLMASFPGDMNRWPLPFPHVDAVASATPLELLGSETLTTDYPLWRMLIGLRPGALGETCAVALLLGLAYLLWRRVITPVIPLTFMGTVVVVALLAGESPVYHLLSGGLLLGAIFMATDYTTTPISTAGHVLFGIGCGLLTMLIRCCGSLPEGVSFAIVLMNIMSPLIERITRPVAFGVKRRWLRREK